jgi:tRNA pseudouridine13 synthase
LEQAVLNQHADLCAGLLREGLEQARRPLRAAVRNVRHAIAGDQVTLEFELSGGAYATAVLRELMEVETASSHDEENGD